MKGRLKAALEDTAWTIMLQEFHVQLKVMDKGKINMNPVLYNKQDEHAHYWCLVPEEDKYEEYFTQRHKLALNIMILCIAWIVWLCTINYTLSVPCLTEWHIDTVKVQWSVTVCIGCLNWCLCLLSILYPCTWYNSIFGAYSK